MKGPALRGQTTQDFAVGIGIFLLTVAFVFAFVPTVLSPYDAGVGASESAQADRTATMLVGNHSADGTPNAIPSDELDAIDDLDEDELHDRAGLPFSSRVNVTVRNVSDGTLEASTGERYDEQGAATATRIVRTDDDRCDPACRITVRVW